MKKKSGKTKQVVPEQIKKPEGRPTKYHEKVKSLEELRKLCGFGVTDQELALFYDVSEQTINAWKIKYPEFLESIKKGKLLANQKVKESLYKSAIGYEIPTSRTKYLPPQPFVTNPNYDPKKPQAPDNRPYVENPNKNPIIVETIQTFRHYPPNPVSAINFLINRDLWRRGDKPDSIGLSNEEVDSLRKIALSVMNEKI